MNRLSVIRSLTLVAGVVVLGAMNQAQAQTKSPIAGLTAMGDVSYSWKGGNPLNDMSEINKHPGVYAGAVINVLWSQIEPTNGTFDFSSINGTGSYAGQGLAAITAYNTAHPSTPIVAKLRLHVDGPPSAPGTPHFALNYGGVNGGVSINPNGSGVDQNQVGTYWGTDTQTAFTALQNALAASYDTNALMGEVTVETCASLGGEPYIEATDSASIATLVSLSGTPYTDAKRQACFTAAAGAYAAWTHTPIDSDYNQFLGTDACHPTWTSGCVAKNPTFTITTIANFAKPGGVRNPRFLAANHDLPGGTTYPITGGLSTFYPEFNTVGPPIELQTTVGLDGVGACQALQLGVQYSMTEMEIHQTYDAGDGGTGTSATLLDDAQLAELKSLLAARDHTSNCNFAPTGVMPVYVAGS